MSLKGLKIIFCAAIAMVAVSAPGRAAEPLNAEARSEAIASIATQIENNFYDRVRGREIAEELRRAEAQGAFAGLDTAEALSLALNARLVEQDNHFTVRYTPGADTGGEPREVAAMGRRDNFGFREVSILPGNIGYIDMIQFYPSAIGGDTAKAALDFIQHTDAVIFDMRDNRGGSPTMVQFLISHFLAPHENVLINTFVSSRRDYPGELRQLDYLPSAARPDVPLYVLTSARSASAGEAFPYHLQAMDRATIVGLRTHGAGNPGRPFPAEHGFSIFVPTSSARNPITQTNWEGTGVTPDVEIASPDALDEALKLAYREIGEASDDPARRTEMEWAIEVIETGTPAVDAARYEDLAGHYGPVEIRTAGEALLLQVGRRQPDRLFPAGEDRFIIENRPDRRLLVRRDRSGQVTGIAHQRPDGGANEMPRAG